MGVCQVCGKATKFNYVLCYDCNLLKEKGEVKKCPDCGKWFLVKNGCNCKKTSEGEAKVSTPAVSNTQKENDELTCIICGAPSNGKHFCKNCYFKYKDRSVDLRITHCNEVEILDEYGNLQYKCADGRKVRSRAEMIISDFLFNNKVRAVYEETIYYKENGEDKTLHPDFYLPDFDLFIEYNELTSKPYLKSKAYTQKIYAELEKNVIIMNEKDLQDISAFLKPKLGLH